MATALRDQLITLYDFTCWARTIVLDRAAALSTEQLEQDSRFPMGSLKETLVHAFSAEWAYRKRLVGEAVTAGLKAEDFADAIALRDAWQEEEGLMRTYLAGVDDETLAGSVSYTTSRGEEITRVRRDFLYQLLFHSAQHRSEAAQMLTEFDQSTGDLDYALYVREKLAG